ncbi:endonuclease/exonuclease/phosphatase family protein [Ruegeria lacuscaerulensis]|uniref:endonuclease/exonuclease/phosphatase family protein n=1 Tax=Ruegeria lacuscaerulensis TaxID=55218 RepID=UPI001481CED2|nr:endonuclease/exonuclease/phosphatase family protein [Ruegeria lacuscaerulensis]
MIRALILLLLPIMAQAEPLRVATFNTELSRDGPGLLLRDIQRGEAQVQAVVEVLLAVQADIVALQGIDWDLNGQTIRALTTQVSSQGLSYPHIYAAQPNSGLETGLDMDGDGRTSGPGDAQGWGRFTGQAGMAVLSRYPITTDQVQEFTALRWRDLPNAKLPLVDGRPFPSTNAQDIQRLSSVAHWAVPIETPQGPLTLMTFHAAPPVFDGSEDRNGLRNHDEIMLWRAVLDGDMGQAPNGPFIIAGDANQDPTQGEGLKLAIHSLLTDPRLTDPRPQDPTGALTTVTWKAVGDLRVDYVLPSAHWTVQRAGVYWPKPGTPERDAAKKASRHRLVWVDIDMD